MKEKTSLSNEILKRVSNANDLTNYERIFLTNFAQSKYLKYYNYKINDLALEFATSSGVINRALEKIGYSTWSYFRPLIKQSVEEINYESKSFDISFTESLEELLKNDNLKKIKNLAESISKKNVILYAEGFSEYAALYFQRGLIKNNIFSVFMSGEKNIDLVNKDKDYVIILISCSGKNRNGYDVLKKISNHHGNIKESWLITGSTPIKNWISSSNTINPYVDIADNPQEKGHPSISYMFLIFYLSKIMSNLKIKK